jgi:ABC-type transporter MlaC component
MSNVYRGKRIWLGICLAMTASWQMPASFADDPKSAVGQIISIIAITPSPEQIDAKLSDRVDYGTITQLAFTPGQWASFNPQQQETLKRAYRDLISRRYYLRWHNLFNKSNVSFGAPAQSGGDSFIGTAIRHGKETDKVNWRLRNNNGRLALVDINVNDKDLIQRLSERSQAELQKQGVNRFIAWIQQEAKQETASGAKNGNEF